MPYLIFSIAEMRTGSNPADINRFRSNTGKTIQNLPKYKILYKIVCLRFENKNCELVQKLQKILLSLSDRVIRITRAISLRYKKNTIIYRTNLYKS